MARGEIKKLSSLFDTYRKKLIAPQASVIDAFVEVVEDLFSFKLPRQSVRYSPATKTLSMTGGGPRKTEIKLREGEVLLHLSGRLGKHNSPVKIV